VRVLVEASDGGVTGAVQQALREDLGLRVQVQLVAPRALPRHELKAQRVVRRPAER
jgi:phenylacetate-coenzyme A ligase PaaK-like adenylate-forming protein